MLLGRIARIIRPGPHEDDDKNGSRFARDEGTRLDLHDFRKGGIHSPKAEVTLKRWREANNFSSLPTFLISRRFSPLSPRGSTCFLPPPWGKTGPLPKDRRVVPTFPPLSKLLCPVEGHRKSWPVEKKARGRRRNKRTDHSEPLYRGRAYNLTSQTNSCIRLLNLHSNRHVRNFDKPAGRRDWLVCTANGNGDVLLKRETARRDKQAWSGSLLFFSVQRRRFSWPVLSFHNGASTQLDWNSIRTNPSASVHPSKYHR